MTCEICNGSRVLVNDGGLLVPSAADLESALPHYRHGTTVGPGETVACPACVPAVDRSQPGSITAEQVEAMR